MTPAAIETLGLAKTYGGRFGTRVEALKPLDLSVPVGSIFGLLGPNGAGKTTLVKLLLGIAHPTAGSATLMGRAIGDAEARRAVGFLPENHRFPDYLTARQAMDLYGRMSGLSDTMARSSRSDDLLARVRLSKAADRRIKTFSKGMMQRLGIAQALLHEPALLFLDDPTDGVDPVGRREIRDLMLELRAEGMTIFLNSHLLSEVEQVCTQVAILKDGALARLGTVDDLTTQARRFRLRATPLPDALRTALADVLHPSDEPPAAGLATHVLHVDDRAHLNALLDRLRAAGVEIEVVQPLKQSLEDYFIEVVTE
ncbi:MAG: ABC transporter ATP-binding protein [Bacteroidota bacterium]